MADDAWHDSWWLPSGPALEVYLLGLVDYEDCYRLQRHLVDLVQNDRPDQACLIVVEHPPIITMGRAASWARVRADPADLARLGVAVRWIDRGGGPAVHMPGQLAVYPIVHLRHWQLSVPDYVRRLQRVIRNTLDEFFIRSETFPRHPGVWAGDAMIAQIGLGIRDWVTYHGLTLNVCPDLRAFDWVETQGPFNGRCTSMNRDRRRSHDMASVRESLVRHFESAFSLTRRHLYTTHPHVTRLARSPAYAGSLA